MESRYCSSTDFETLLAHWKHKHRQSVANTTQPTGTFWFCCLGEGRLSEKTVKYSHGVYTRSSRFGWLLRASTYSHVRNVVLSWTLSPVVWHLRNLKSWNSTFQTVCPVGGYCCAVFGKPKLSVMFRLHKQTQVVLFFLHRSECFVTCPAYRFQCSFAWRKCFLWRDKKKTRSQTWEQNKPERNLSVREKRFRFTLCSTWRGRLCWCLYVCFQTQTRHQTGFRRLFSV